MRQWWFSSLMRLIGTCCQSYALFHSHSVIQKILTSLLAKHKSILCRKYFKALACLMCCYKTPQLKLFVQTPQVLYYHIQTSYSKVFLTRLIIITYYYQMNHICIQNHHSLTRHSKKSTKTNTRLQQPRKGYHSLDRV